VYHACQKAAQHAGLQNRVHPHTLRHYVPFLTMSCDRSLAQYFRLFPADARSRRRHSIDSFHQPRAGGNGSVVSYIFDYQIVLERALEDPYARRIRPFARSVGEQGHTRDSIHRQVLCALWLGHERVRTTPIHLEATTTTKEKAHAKTSLAHGRRVAINRGLTLRLLEASAGSKRLCRATSRGFATRRPELRGHNPQRCSVTRHSQEGYIVPPMS
jgi:hypothetical protein